MADEKKLDATTESILDGCFGNSCGKCLRKNKCENAETNARCKDYYPAYESKCRTCVKKYKSCKSPYPSEPCSDYEDYPAGHYNGDDVISKEARIGEPEDHKEIRAMMANMIIVRKAIREKHPVGKEFVEGSIDCPICGKKRWFMISDHYNGHIHSKCEDPNCVNWME